MSNNNPKINIEQFSVQDNTCVYGHKEWFVTTLFRAAEGIEPYDLQLSALNLDVSFPTSDTIANFCYQMKRVQDADLSYPIIQAPDGWIMDGFHRIVKAIIEGRITIKAVRLKVLPNPDRIIDNGKEEAPS